MHDNGGRIGSEHAYGVAVVVSVADKALAVSGFDAIEHIGNRLAGGFINQLEAFAVFGHSHDRREGCGADLSAHEHVARAGDDHTAMGGATAEKRNGLAVDQDVADPFGDRITARR